MQTIISKCILGKMWDFTWDDLACLFLGFDEELFLSAKKKPDILFFIAERNLETGAQSLSSSVSGWSPEGILFVSFVSFVSFVYQGPVHMELGDLGQVRYPALVG